MNTVALTELRRNNDITKAGKNWTCIGFVLDRSASMQSMEDEARDGYNHFVEGQVLGPDLAALTTVLFDHELFLVETFKDVRYASPLNVITYKPRGTTALLDAMGRTIELIGHTLDRLPEEQKPRRVIIVTLTDGQENASKYFLKAQIQHMVKIQREVYSWEFLFLGAGLDTIDIAQSYGIPKTHAAVMHTGGKGMSTGMDSIKCAVNAYRMGPQGAQGPEGPEGLHYTSHLASNKHWGGDEVPKK